MADVVANTSVLVPLQFFRMHLDPAHACCRFAARLVSADGTYLSADTTTLFIDAMLQEADARHSSWCGSAQVMPWTVWRPGNGSFFMAESSYIAPLPRGSPRHASTPKPERAARAQLDVRGGEAAAAQSCRIVHPAAGARFTEVVSVHVVVRCATALLGAADVYRPQDFSVTFDDSRP